MKIYSRTGDLGETGLYGGPRVGKDTARIEALGTIDELNALLGLVRAEALAGPLDALVERVQHELFAIGAELATPDPVAHRTRAIGPAHIKALEVEIERLASGLAPLDGFILPGGSRAGAGLHLARTVCRRAERRLVRLVREAPGEVSLVLMAYLNRLADLLFVLARTANAQAGVLDIAWKKPDAFP